MLFLMLDRILEVEPGKRLVGVHRLKSEEEYLQDHFPSFPVMPGVLMLDSMFQAAMWFLRLEDDFAYPIILLREARNVRYSDFVTPGQELRVTAEVFRREEPITVFKCQGEVDGRVAVSGRLFLERLAEKDRRPNLDPPNGSVARVARKHYAMIAPPS